MRIDRLVLARYGHFTDFTLDFGKPPMSGDTDHSDLHLVYGPNETGKSTTLHAITDLLFGMPSRTPYNFLHAYRSLEVRARLSFGGQHLDVRRFKNHLSDGEGRRVADSYIDTKGLTRASFTHRFTVDDDTLQQGGEEILLNRGDLGESLFSATTGLTDIQQRLEAAIEPSRGFYDGGKQKGIALYDMRRELETIDADLKRIDLNAHRYRQQREAADAAHDACVAHAEQVSALERTLETVQRRHQCKSTAQRLKELRDARERLPRVPELPAGWIDEYRMLLPEYTRLTTRLAATEEELARQREAMETLAPDQTLLKHASAVDEQLASRGHREALAEQLAEWRDDYAALGQRLSDMSQSIGCPVTAAQLPAVLSDKLLDGIEELASEYREKLTAHRRAEQELDDVQDRLHTQGPPPTPPAAMDLLENLESVLDTDSPLHRLEQVKRHRSDLEHDLTRALAALIPWRGEPTALLTLAVPSLSEVQTLLATMREKDLAVARVEQRIEQTRQELESLDGESEPGDTLLLDETAWQQIRERRDAAWKAHEILLDTDTVIERLRLSAREFTERMREDDWHTARRLEFAVDIARQRQIAARRKHLKRALQSAASDLECLHGEQRQTCEQIHRLLQACELPVHMPLTELPGWVKRREAALELHDRYAQAGREATRLQQQSDRLAGRLRTLLAAGRAIAEPLLLESADLTELRALARQRLDELRREYLQYVRQCQTREELEREMTRRQVAVKHWRRAFEAAQSDWQRLLADCWLGEWTFERVSATLGHLRTCRQLAEQHAELGRRIASSEAQSNRRMQQQIACLRNSGMLADSNRSPAALEAALNATARAVEAAREQDRERQRRLVETERLTQEAASLRAELEPVRRRLDAMQCGANVASYDQIEPVLEHNASRRALDARCKELELELLERLSVESLDIALEQLEATDSVDLEAEISRARTRLKQAQTTLTELHHRYRSVAEPLETLCGDDAAARLVERRENLRLDMAERARLALAARAGHRVVTDSLRRYRECHRSDMLLCARDAFVTLTDGHFSDLTTQPADNGGGEHLIAVRPGGRSLHAEQMSKGTRFQLYLALRIAAYHDYCRHRTPMPFIADDIMETFDDRRAAAACREMANMARYGQVIYLTHHRHLIRIAEQVAGEALSVHELPVRGS